MSIAFNPAPSSISRTPKVTLAVAAAAVGTVLLSAALSRGAPQAAPIYLAAPPAAIAVAPGGEGRSAVLYSADGRSKITITVEDVAASPASAPARRDEIAPEAEVRHASTRP